MEQGSERAKRAPRQGTRSRRHQENILVPGKELEDEAAGRPYATKASVLAYSELTDAAQGGNGERADGELDEEGPRQGARPREGRRDQSKSGLASCRPTPLSSLSLSSSSLPLEEESSLSEDLSMQHFR